MEIVPELGYDEEVLALDESVFDGLLEALTSFLFVAVDCVICQSFDRLTFELGRIGKLTVGPIKVTVADLYGIVDLVRCNIGSDLPKSVARKKTGQNLRSFGFGLGTLLPKARKWHVIAARQLDGTSKHFVR